MRIVTLLLSVAACVVAQSADSSPNFNSVTIKNGSPTSRAPWNLRPVNFHGCTGGPANKDPRLLMCNASLTELLARAYRLGPAQLIGPAWMATTWFKIEAKVPAGATEEQLPAMERNLLAERFKLAAHFDKQDGWAYVMTVGKDGPKLKEWDGRKDPEAGDAWGCGRYLLQGGRSIQELAAYLAYNLDRPVVDDTGLTGVYNLRLHAAGPVLPACGGRGPDNEPALPDAVHAQLGLDLEWQKGTFDFLVIDQIEKKPTANP